MDKRLSRVCVFDQEPDETVVYKHDQCTCLMRLFPTCNQRNQPPVGDPKRFHLRFYLPRDVIASAHAKFDRLIVMTNGLDEIDDFDLYDELGSRFAARGIAAVLLPLPDHLNRHMRYRIPSASFTQIVNKPSDILMKEPGMLYTRFLQYREELNFLVDHVRGRVSRCRSEQCKFYKDLFSRQTRISVLGYSLGGAAMLSCFLEGTETHRDFNTCLLLSAAVPLRETDPGKMFEEGDWADYVEKLESAFLALGRRYRKGTEEASKLFGAICFSQDKGLLRKSFMTHSRKVLFLFGGKDNVTGAERLTEIEPRDWGLNKLVFAGINHFLAIDEEFKQWIDLVVNLMADFELHGPCETITIKKAGKHFKNLKKHKGPDKSKREASRSVLNRAWLLGYDVNEAPGKNNETKKAERINYKELRDALEAFAPETRGVALQGRTKAAQFLQSRKLGHILRRLGIIKSSDIIGAIRLQEEYSQRGKWKRIGQILVDPLGILNKHKLGVFTRIIKKSSDLVSRGQE